MIQQPTITEALPKPAEQLRACLQSRTQPDSHLCRIPHHHPGLHTDTSLLSLGEAPFWPSNTG